MHVVQTPSPWAIVARRWTWWSRTRLIAWVSASHSWGNSWATWEPNIVEIEAAIGTAFNRYKVVAFYADPGKDWRSHINAWEAKWGAKVQIK